MAKQKRKLIEKLLFEVYDKGVQRQDCNLTDYYEKIKQALNIPDVSRRSELLAAFSWVSSIGEQFFDSSKTVEDMVDTYLKSRQ